MKRQILSLALLVGNCLLVAQATTSSLGGRITDNNDEGLFGATVQAVHTPTGTRYGTTAQDGGYYNLTNLRVGGPYTVSVTYVGFQADTTTGINLVLGEKRQLDITLGQDGQVLDEVVVSARKNSVINSDRTGAATQIGSAELERLPTISRSASDFTRLTPSSDGNSFGGRNDQYNNFTLDGSIFNNPFGLDAATAGGQSNAQPISLDAIDQIQVNLAPYDVTQAGFTGAAVNAVTKSGTNTPYGTVYTFYRNQDMTGSSVAGEDIFVPELRQRQSGFSLAGPIVKDKLFFFANFELERRQDLGTNFIAARAGLEGDQVSRVQASDLDAISNVLDERFGYQTGPYEGYLHDTDNEKGIFKLDWNIGTGNTITATYNFLNAGRDNNAHPSALGRRGPDATTLQFFNSGYRINNKINSGIVEWRSLFGNFSNKLQVGYTSYEDSRTPFSTPFPSLLIQRDGSNYIVAGHEPFSINNRLDQSVFQFTNNLQYFAGKHTFTAGVSFERFDFDNSFNLGRYLGVFGPVNGGAQVSPQAFVDSVRAGVLDEAVAAARASFAAGNEPGDGYNGTNFALAETNVGQLGLYIQDEITLTQDFTLTLGLRVDRPLYFDTQEKIEENIARKGGTIDEGGTYAPDVTYYNEDNEAVQLNSTELPDNSFLFSPRLGFNWDVTGDQRFQLRGGSGLFTGRFPFVWVGNQVANPDFFFYNTTAPSFQFPQVWRSNLGVDLSIGGGWTVTTDLIYTADQNAMMVRNYGLRTPEGTLPGVDNRPIYRPEDRAAGVFGGTTNAYVFTNTDIGNSFNASVEIKRNFASGLFASIGYNYLRAQEASSIEAEISSDAYERNPAFGNVNQAVLSPSLYGNRHRVVGSASKQFRYGGSDQWGTTFALFFQYAEGGRFSYTYSGDINNDGSGLNDLIYIPTDGDLDAMTFDGGDSQREALRSYIEQDEYLSDRRGDYAERYAILSPWFSNYDLRVAQNLTIADSRQVELTLDILNIGNLFNSNWGVRQFPTNNQPIGVRIDEEGSPVYSFDEALTSTFTNDFSLLSRWQAQVGLRYRF